MRRLVVLLQHGTKADGPVDPGLTAAGRRQVQEAADALAGAGVDALVTSPRRRARESIGPLARATGLPVVVDDRVRERMEFDPATWSDASAFVAEWEHATRDRAFVPAARESSGAAADRLRAAVLDHGSAARLTVVATHGGVTVDLLRDLLGDDGVDERLIRFGVPGGRLSTLAVDGRALTVLGAAVDPADWTG